jgi:hypothetical protein
LRPLTFKAEKSKGRARSTASIPAASARCTALTAMRGFWQYYREIMGF